MELIKVVDNNIQVNNDFLKNIIINEWKELYKFYRDFKLCDEKRDQFILDDLSDCAIDIYDDIEKKAQKDLGWPEIRLDLDDKYLKSDVRSIGFCVLNFLEFAWTYSPTDLSIKDISFIVEFLDTSSDKVLEAWKKWENYWSRVIQEQEGWSFLMTYSDDGWSGAIDLLIKMKKEFEDRRPFSGITIALKCSGKRMAYYCCEGSFIQLKIRKGIPIMIIIDAVKKSKKKIIFKYV